MGIGYTLNFGNPWAWILVVALVLIPMLLKFAIRSD